MKNKRLVDLRSDNRTSMAGIIFLFLSHHRNGHLVRRDVEVFLNVTTITAISCVTT